MSTAATVSDWELCVKLPDVSPFDNDRHYESYIGNVVVPLIQTGLIPKFWFSHYGRTGDAEVKLRYTTTNYPQLQPTIASLVTQFGLNVVADQLFNIVGDLSGQPRFLGQNARQQNGNGRGVLIYDFLHSSSQLFVDCLSHRDGQGYWYVEANQDAGNSHHGSSLETVHHLFCNVSNVPTSIVIVKHQTGFAFLSPLYAKINGLYAPGLPEFKVDF